MEINVDMTDVTEGGVFVTIPEGQYTVQIKEATDGHSKAGDPMINVMMEVVVGEFAGAKLWDNILFPPADSTRAKILGRSMHFLHCIGEPYEGKFKVQTENWPYQKCSIMVKHEQPNEYHSYVKVCVAGYSELDATEKKDTENNDPAIPF